MASRASDYVNGHILAVDGGWLSADNEKADEQDRQLFLLHHMRFNRQDLFDLINDAFIFSASVNVNRAAVMIRANQTPDALPYA